MGKLVYCLNVSLDGFVAAADGDLAWGSVDDELHAWFNDREQGLDASLYGRRLYELMAAYWPTADADPAATATMREFARIWLETPKIVFSTSLRSVAWNSRLVAGDVGERLAEVRAEFPGDLGVGGPDLAARFIERGLVDEYLLLVHPVILGAGTPLFPALRDPIRLRLVETRTFRSGVVLVRYEADRDPTSRTRSAP
jgi:dihydrofolate reductase